MKKEIKKKIALIKVFAGCMMLAACGSKLEKEPVSSTSWPLYINNEYTGENTDNTDDNNYEQNEELGEEKPLQDVYFSFAQAFSCGGIDSFYGIVENPNDVPVDITCDVVYYDYNGSEISRGIGFFNNCIPAHGSSVMWDTCAPYCENVAVIKMENVCVCKSYYEPVEVSYKDLGIIGNDHCYELQVNDDFDVVGISFPLFVDKNGNKKLDDGDLMKFMPYAEIYPGEDAKACYDISVGDYAVAPKVYAYKY